MTGPTLRQIPVLPPEPKKSKQIEDDTASFLPRKFFSLLVCGKRFSGKTSLLTWCLSHPRGWLKNYSEVIIFSPTIKTDPQWTAIESYDNVLFSETVSGPILDAILQRQKGLHKKSKKNTLLLILDDLSSTIKDKKSGLEKMLNKIWTTVRHWGVSVALTCQTASHASTTIRGNSTNVWAFRMGDREINMLADEYSSLFLPQKEFKKALMNATSKPFSFFNIDFQQTDPDLVYGPMFREKT